MAMDGCGCAHGARRANAPGPSGLGRATQVSCRHESRHGKLGSRRFQLQDQYVPSGTKTGMIDGMDVSVMEPMLVEASELALADIAAALLVESHGLAKRMHPIVRESVGALVRSIICFRSNLNNREPRHETARHRSRPGKRCLDGAAQAVPAARGDNTWNFVADGSTSFRMSRSSPSAYACE